jgi:hypothetical protein
VAGAWGMGVTIVVVKSSRSPSRDGPCDTAPGEL